MAILVDSHGFAEEGSYAENTGEVTPFGGVVLVPEAPMLSPTINSQSVDSGSIGLPDPLRPVITPPATVVLLSNEGENIVSFDEVILSPVPLPEFNTKFSFVSSDTSRDALTSIPITVGGLLQEKLTGAGLDPIKGSIEIREKQDSPLLTMKFTLPNSAAALEVFKKNKNLSKSLSIFCDYQILYQVNGFSDSKVTDYFRYKGSFGTAASLSFPGVDPIRPSVGTFTNSEEVITLDFPEVETEVSLDDPETTIVTSKELGTSIKVPTNLIALTNTGSTKVALNTTNNNSPYIVGSLSGERRFNTVTSVGLDSETILKKKELFLYSNGISNSSYSIIETRTQAEVNTVTQSFSQDFSTTGEGGKKLVFSSEVDDSVASIHNINNKSMDYSDIFYNTLTSEKIESSISKEVDSILTSTLGLNGQALKKSISLSLREALIRGEESFFTLEDIQRFQKEQTVKDPVEKNRFQTLDNISALDAVLQEAISINPEAYDIKAKNRLVNWKTLAEDVNKRIIYKTSNQVDHTTYIPNNEKITVKDSAGVEHSLGMQDGDFFTAFVNDGVDRLSVFSDIENAYTLDSPTIEKAAFLANEDYAVTLDCCSTTSELIEYTVDLTSARQEYYFLSLDKDSIEDLPDSSLFTRKTGATYNYITTGIDTYVKHKAFPYAVIYLRHDDMLLNHLESSKIANFIFRDFTLENFRDTPNILIPRVLPQHVVIIPTDLTTKSPYQTRSKAVSFNKRRVRLKNSPFLTDIYGKLASPTYLSSEVTTTDSVNFTSDVENGIYYQEGLKYYLNTTGLAEINKYKNKKEYLPRSLLPIPALFEKLTNIKSVFSLSPQDSISFYDLYSQLEPKIFRSLSIDSLEINEFNSKLRYNINTEDKKINKSNFVQVKEISNINNKSATLLTFPEGTVWSSRTSRSTASQGATTPLPAPTPHATPPSFPIPSI